MVTDAMVEAALAVWWKMKPTEQLRRDIYQFDDADFQKDLALMRAAIIAAERAAWRPIEEVINEDELLLCARRCADGSWIYETWHSETLRTTQERIATGLYQKDHLTWYPEVVRHLPLPPEGE